MVENLQWKTTSNRDISRFSFAIYCRCGHSSFLAAIQSPKGSTLDVLPSVKIQNNSNCVCRKMSVLTCVCIYPFTR